MHLSIGDGLCRDLNPKSVNCASSDTKTWPSASVNSRNFASASAIVSRGRCSSERSLFKGRVAKRRKPPCTVGVE